MHRFKKKEYDKGPLTVVWDMPKCIHSEKCWRGLGEVFRRNDKPWINLDGAANDTIMKQIDQCPSGALSYRHEGKKNKEKMSDNVEVTIAKDGPVLMSGKLVIKHSDGHTEEREGNTALCRCGASTTKPYCDGSHNGIEFKG
ncbi:MAG: hypothetical protein HKN45_09510 [Flavobacteriales bacterium]|nr:hypothetical protein [Flavobacteriales bacterium]